MTKNKTKSKHIIVPIRIEGKEYGIDVYNLAENLIKAIKIASKRKYKAFSLEDILSIAIRISAKKQPYRVDKEIVKYLSTPILRMRINELRDYVPIERWAFLTYVMWLENPKYTTISTLLSGMYNSLVDLYGGLTTIFALSLPTIVKTNAYVKVLDIAYRFRNRNNWDYTGMNNLSMLFIKFGEYLEEIIASLIDKACKHGDEHKFCELLDYGEFGRFVSFHRAYREWWRSIGMYLVYEL